MTENLERIRKGMVYMCNIPKTENRYLLYSLHPVCIWSNHKVCDFNANVQIIPITSQDKKPLDTHIKLSKGIANLEEDSTVLTDQLQTLDKKFLMYKIGELPTYVINQIERGLNIQLNSNRFFNISFANKLLNRVISLDNLTEKYANCEVEVDNDDIELRRILLNDLREYCYQYSIDYKKLCLEGGLKSE